MGLDGSLTVTATRRSVQAVQLAVKEIYRHKLRQSPLVKQLIGSGLSKHYWRYSDDKH